MPKKDKELSIFIDELGDLGEYKDTSNNIVFAKAKTKNQGNYHTGHLDNRLNRGAHNYLRNLEDMF